MAGTSIKAGGKFREVVGIRHNISGAWVNTKRAWHKNAGGTWERFFPNAIVINVTGTVTNFNLFVAAGSPAGPVNVEVRVWPGARVLSNSVATPAFDVGAFDPGSVINILNEGLITGKGGDGGRGAYYGSSSGYPGTSGGPAFKTTIAVTINNQGTIASGGGGGGGGGWYDLPRGRRYSGGGGGGGAGSNEYPGIGGGAGAAGVPGNAGQNGGDAPGLGGYGAYRYYDGNSAALDGGNGGDRGSAGAAGNQINGDRARGNGGAGAAAGYSVIGNSYINWTNLGTILGIRF